MTEILKPSDQELAIQEQLVDYQNFNSVVELEEYLGGQGLGKDTPKLILWHVISNDAMSEQNDVPALLIGENAVGNILEGLADRGGGIADHPNDFTVGLVLGLDDGNHLAIKYRSEECSISDLEFETRLDPLVEREFDYERVLEVAICIDYRGLLWHDDGNLVDYGL